jgi:LPXTG-motif cell wall-anchored protein
MWWPPVVVGLLMLGTGLVFLVRRKALAKVYAQRVKALPPEHPQYRATPFATPGMLAAVGVLGVVGGIGAILLGIFMR